MDNNAPRVCFVVDRERDEMRGGARRAVVVVLAVMVHGRRVLASSTVYRVHRVVYFVYT